jgi:hypothetical protein
MQKYALHPASVSALGSLLNKSFIKALVNGLIRINVVSDKARADRNTLVVDCRKYLVRMIINVRMFPVKPSIVNTGTVT